MTPNSKTLLKHSFLWDQTKEVCYVFNNQIIVARTMEKTELERVEGKLVSLLLTVYLTSIK